MDVMALPARISDAHQSPVPAGALTALVVEDDPQVGRPHTRTAGGGGIHGAPRRLRGGGTAALVIERPVSLITLDIMLPEMDGWEFLGRLMLLPERGNIPVVIVSIVADRVKGFALGAAAVMQKPISRHELYRSLLELGLFPLVRGAT